AVLGCGIGERGLGAACVIGRILQTSGARHAPHLGPSHLRAVQRHMQSHSLPPSSYDTPPPGSTMSSGHPDRAGDRRTFGLYRAAHRLPLRYLTTLALGSWRTFVQYSTTRAFISAVASIAEAWPDDAADPVLPAGLGQHGVRAGGQNAVVTFRSGFACFVGRPNAGRPTRPNALVGTKVAITSNRPQTTRHAIRGILHRPDAQLILVDTPGLHKPRTLLGQRLNDLVRTTWAEVDVIGFCLPADEPV